MTEILDIVDENDEVVGQMERGEVHTKGLRYRSIHVIFYTPAGDVIMQRRSMSKAIAPGLLTTTVSGHVESGMSYLETAVKETFEESGIVVGADVLVDLGKMYFVNPNASASGSMKEFYAYRFEGAVDDLQVEEGEADGFEVFTLGALQRALVDTPDDFTVLLTMADGRAMIDKIEDLLS